MSYSFLSIKVSEDLHRQLKIQAAKEKKAMGKIVEELIQKYLNT